MLKKSTFREIKSSLARYLAIFAIVALGVGFFAGLKDCKASMVKTADKYLKKHNLFDYQLMSSYGIDDESVALAKSTEGVEQAEGSIQIDVIAEVESDELILKAISLPDQINTLRVVKGRLPENANECVVDDYELRGGDYKIGSTIKLSNGNDKDTLKEFKTKEYKIVGMVNTPIYMDYQRGSTTLGDGSIDTFFYLSEDAFDLDYYTSLYVKLEGKEYTLSDELNAKLDKYEKPMETLAEDITAARRETARKDAQEELDEKKQEYEDSLAEYESQKSAAENKINKAEKKLNSGSKTLSNSKTSTNATLADLQGKKSQLESGISQLQTGIDGCEAKKQAETDPDKIAQIEAQETKLKSDLEVAQSQLSQVNSGISQAQAGLATIAGKEKEISKGKKTLTSQKKKADTEFADAKAKLDEAKEELDEAQEKIDDMETGNSYALSRRDNSGYSSFESNSDILNNIAKVFPVFFFLVAALVCMTTMTRMIDEQRTQIGILKALGYSNGSILGKYMFYSGSGALLGAVFGFFVGCKVFPAVIWHAYTMMYDFSDTVDFVFDWKLMLISLAVAMLCSVGATWVSISADFKVAPADLIRPKTPRAGKRILLERIDFIWKKISFLYKVSLRNIFRYKKRFFMMVLGVSGCTALLIAGIGINTTISKVAEYQFSEISLYDYQVVFDHNMDVKAQKNFNEYFKEKCCADGTTDNDSADDSSALFIHQAAADMITKDKNLEVTIFATDSDDFSKYISLHNGDEKIEVPGEGEIVIVRKVQKELGVDVGDEVRLKDGYKEMTAKVVAVSDNYVGENIYMSETAYEKGFGKDATIKSALVKMDDSLSNKQVRRSAALAGKYDDAAAVVLNLDTLDIISNMMKSLNAVVYVVILCAGLLAFIVLYNLTNINITERIREIATIKVLGFNQVETSQYVFRENLFLTAIAAVVGIPMGKWLLDFVIGNIVVSMIYFQPRINTIDYVIAVVLTFVFAFIVNLAMQKRLRDVSMTESLKSVE